MDIQTMNDFLMMQENKEYRYPSFSSQACQKKEYEDCLSPNQHHSSDESEQPEKIRKRPGRKPNPASPALRKAQNRAAQRAFRERKERHLHELEGTIRQLREQKTTMANELKQAKSDVNAYRVENWYLKGIVLTLQFVCLHHCIPIPTHSPYLSEEALDSMAKVQPHGIEAYVNAYTKNNIDLKPTVAAHFANTRASSPDQYDDENESVESEIIAGEEPRENKDHSPSMSSAIKRIRHQLQEQPFLIDKKKYAARLQPTILQLAISHDPRIDIIPTPHMRDRMILFRDLMDYDRCFSLLTNGANYHGGDPTSSSSWEIPESFLDEFWYLATNYNDSRIRHWKKDVVRSNREKDLMQAHSDDVLWSDPIFSQAIADMFSLKQLGVNQFPNDLDFSSSSINDTQQYLDSVNLQV